MMLNKTIAHYEEQAKIYRSTSTSKSYFNPDASKEDAKKADECAQLAHLLMELKIYRDGGKRGKWNRKDGAFECDQCGYEVVADDTEDFKFCPWCGAKMMEGDANDT